MKHFKKIGYRFDSSQVKRHMISSTKNIVYEGPCKLTSDLGS